MTRNEMIGKLQRVSDRLEYLPAADLRGELGDVLAALATPAPVAPDADGLCIYRRCNGVDGVTPHDPWCPTLAAPVAAPPADLVATCEWSEDANGEWHTGCGTLFVFDTDGPTEHKFGWCYHCGKPLAPVPFLLPEVPK